MASNVAAMLLHKRDDTDYYDNESWWWSDTGVTVRYTVIFIIFALFVLLFVGGYFHARSRMRKGLQPLSYHRWMVKSRYQQPQYYQNAPPQQGYPMYAYPPGQEGPPAYNQHAPPPPAYSPPEGASKAMADQNYRGQYEPAGQASQSVAPPPAAAAPRL